MLFAVSMKANSREGRSKKKTKSTPESRVSEPQKSGIPIDDIPIKGEKLGDYISLTCNVCGEQFERQVGEIKKAKEKGCKFIYCSKKCSAQGQQGTFISTNDRQRWKVFAEKMKQKYGDVCEKCGWPECLPNFQRKRNPRTGKLRRYTDAHHIVEKSEGGPIFDERNIILLCPNDHRLADRGYFTPEELQKIIQGTRL